MRRRGITMKLFVITALFFLLFYAIVMVGQLFLFERFYQHHKTATLETKLRTFSDIYTANRWSDARILREIALFNRQNKAQLVILGPEGNVKHDNFFRVVIQDDSGRSIRISLTFLQNADLRKLLEANLQRGDRIEVQGSYDSSGPKDLFYPSVIRKDGFQQIGQVAPEEIGRLETYSGVITDILLPTANQWNTHQIVLFLALDDWFPLSEERRTILQGGGMVEEEWNDALSGTRSIVAIQPVMREGKASELIFVLASLQEISEANDALQLFYVYIGIGGIALILLLSIVFTKIVSKPLLSLNQIALRMAKLDFTVKSPIRNNDEFGSLSRSLNSLSEKLNDTLQELYEANGQLRTDVENKQRIEQQQKEFTANVSHELKTPLSIVKGYVEGIRDGIDESKRDRYLEVILGETEKMEALINDMLELAKLEAKTIKLRMSRFALSELTENIADKLSQHLSDKELKVSIITIGEHEVFADPAKMEQVLVNLLMNAIRHAAASSEIAVRIEEEGERMRLSIDNVGNHIPEEELDTIWERFYRVERSRNRKTGGTGLGLAIVKHILELHGSEYGVENTERGVSFYFYL